MAGIDTLRAYTDYEVQQLLKPIMGGLELAVRNAMTGPRTPAKTVALRNAIDQSVASVFGSSPSGQFDEDGKPLTPFAKTVIKNVRSASRAAVPDGSHVKQAVEDAISWRDPKGRYLQDRIYNNGQEIRTRLTVLIGTHMANNSDVNTVIAELRDYLVTPRNKKRVMTDVGQDGRFGPRRLLGHETNRIYGDGVVYDAVKDGAVVKWTLAEKGHAKQDICDQHAHLDTFGLGPGVFLPYEVPKFPGHVGCKCILVKVKLAPKPKPAPPKPPEPAPKPKRNTDTPAYRKRREEAARKRAEKEEAKRNKTNKTSEDEASRRAREAQERAREEYERRLAEERRKYEDQLRRAKEEQEERRREAEKDRIRREAEDNIRKRKEMERVAREAKKQTAAERKAAEQATATQPFKPAKTAKEAQDYARNVLGIKDARYDDVRMGNTLNEGLHRMKQKGYPMMERVWIDASRFGKGSNAIAHYDPNVDAFVCNSNAPFWNNPGKVARQSEVTHFWTSGDPLHVVYHEMGHWENWQKMGQLGSSGRVNHWIAWGSKSGTAPFTSAELSLVRKHVSTYGATCPLEMVAEVYAGHLAGKTFPPEIIAIYKRFYGPPLR